MFTRCPSTTADQQTAAGVRPATEFQKPANMLLARAEGVTVEGARYRGGVVPNLEDVAKCSPHSFALLESPLVVVRPVLGAVARVLCPKAVTLPLSGASLPFQALSTRSLPSNVRSTTCNTVPCFDKHKLGSWAAWETDVSVTLQACAPLRSSPSPHRRTRRSTSRRTTSWTPLTTRRCAVPARACSG